MAKCRQCGNSGLFLKIDSSGLCAHCAESVINNKRLYEMEHLLDQAKKDCEQIQFEYAALQATITPDMQDAISLRHAVEHLNKTKEELVRAVDSARDELSKLQSEIIVAGDAIEMESFSLYTPRYSFVSSAEYKERLDQVRSKQKDMIRDKTACVCSTEWTVNGSKVEGRKQTNDNIKLFLRAFNLECESAVSDVKFSNYTRCQERITKAYDAINALGRVSHITISPRYHNLKIDELCLAHEYALKKQQEKEEQAEIRRQQREQAKLDKEIAEARKAAEKERQHYEQALANIDTQIAACTDPEQKAALKVKRTEIRDGLDGVEAKLEDIDYRQTNQRAGYVYIISNIGAFGENVYKIGMTRRLNPMERVDELGDASVPFVFDVHAMIFSADAPALESALHRAFEDRRINKVNPRREYFRVTLDEIKEVVRRNHDKSVEFIDVPDAEQYRQSIKM